MNKEITIEMFLAQLIGGTAEEIKVKPASAILNRD